MKSSPDHHPMELHDGACLDGVTNVTRRPQTRTWAPSASRERHQPFWGKRMLCAPYLHPETRIDATAARYATQTQRVPDPSHTIGPIRGVDLLFGSDLSTEYPPMMPKRCGPREVFTAASGQAAVNRKLRSGKSWERTTQTWRGGRQLTRSGIR
jgi:hypothetical protein